MGRFPVKSVPAGNGGHSTKVERDPRPKNPSSAFIDFNGVMIECRGAPGLGSMPDPHSNSVVDRVPSGDFNHTIPSLIASAIVAPALPLDTYRQIVLIDESF